MLRLVEILWFIFGVLMWVLVGMCVLFFFGVVTVVTLGKMAVICGVFFVTAYLFELAMSIWNP